MNDPRLHNTLEAALFAAGRPLSLDELLALVEGTAWQTDRGGMRAVLAELATRWEERALELVEVASGYRFQVRRDYSQLLGRLWAERPPRYSRALLETLAIIAYRQPVTRAEIEEIRGVAVSPSILKTLQEREWIRALGHKEVPGRPELLGTTRQFLDDFGLPALDALPPLAEIRDLEAVHADLFPETTGVATAVPEPAGGLQGMDARTDAGAPDGTGAGHGTRDDG